MCMRAHIGTIETESEAAPQERGGERNESETRERVFMAQRENRARVKSVMMCVHKLIDPYSNSIHSNRELCK